MTAEKIARRVEPFFAAVEAGDLSSVRNYLERLAGAVNLRDSVLGETPLHAACCFGHLHVASLLIERGADVDAGDVELGLTPLHWAASSGHIDVARLLLQAGANPTTADKRGLTPLDVALERHNTSILAVLRDTEALSPLR